MAAASLPENVREIPREQLGLRKAIGHGSTGQVHVGEYDGQEVAIKEVTDPWGAQPSSPFAREIHVLSRASHPNVVALLGVVTKSMPLYIVLEFCAGGTCAERLYSATAGEELPPLSWRQTRKIVSDTCEAVKYLHALDPPIVHRDLKSMNLLLVAPVDGPQVVPEVKLCDFGVARAKSAEEGMTPRAKSDDDWPIMTKAVGTCNWVAPEVFMGHIYDEKVDVYAFAMVCFEATFYELPFEELEPSEITALVTSGKRPSLEDPPPGIPEPFLRLIELCWAHHKHLRPTFDEIARYISTLVR